MARRQVTPVNTDYSIATMDDVVAVDCSQSPITCTLFSSPTVGESHTVLDASRSSGKNPITVDGGGNLIDGRPKLVIDSNGWSYDIVFTSFGWSVV